MKKITGIDLSLTATGIADVVLYAPGDLGGAAKTTALHTVKSHPSLPMEERLMRLLTDIRELVSLSSLAVIEGLSFNSKGGGASERAALHWMVRCTLRSVKCPFLIVAPTMVKKFACGSGKAEKSTVVREVYRRWDVEASNDNEADAAVLAHIGIAYLDIEEAKTSFQQEVIHKLKQTNRI